MDDRHAAARDKKRRGERYGHTTTNPGMRIVMRDLAHKAHEDVPEPDREPAKGVECEEDEPKRHQSHRHGIGDQHSPKDES